MSRMGYELSGDVHNPAILFLHGFMSSSADWQEVIAALEDRSFCVAVDLPGHGESVELPAESYSFEGAAWELLGLLDELDIESPAVVGYSMGGRLALYLALCRPEHCAGLFLESASPGLDSKAERQSRRASDEKLARRLESEDFGEFLESWYRQPLFASLSRHEGLVEKLVAKRRYNEPTELARSLRGMGTGSQPSLWDELSGLQVPALAVAGELDEKFVGIARRMASLNYLMKEVVVPSAGHNVHVENRSRHLELLEEFLGENG